MNRWLQENALPALVIGGLIALLVLYAACGTPAHGQERPAATYDFAGVRVRRIKNRLEVCTYDKEWNLKIDDEGTKLWRRTKAGYVEFRFANELVLTHDDSEPPPRRGSFSWALGALQRGQSVKRPSWTAWLKFAKHGSLEVVDRAGDPIEDWVPTREALSAKDWVAQ